MYAQNKPLIRMTVLSPFVCSVRNLSSQSFRSLPVILGSAVLLLGLAQGNFNLMFFFIGMCIVAPTATLLANTLWELIFSNTPGWLTVPYALWRLQGFDTAACAVFPVMSGDPSGIQNVVPSYWMSMIAFAITYMWANAKMLYDKQADTKAPQAAVEARKSQAVLSMMILTGFAIFFTLARYASGCETGLGMILSWLLGGWLGFGWYKFMRACGLGRLDDLFGISNRILPQQAYEDQVPTVCAPTQTS